MSEADRVILALTAWRENRGAGGEGMQSVINVVQNRCHRHGTSPWQECIRPLQFSSITAHGDPELTLWPAVGDQQWNEALWLAAEASAGTLADLTQGATLYFAPQGMAAANVQQTASGPLPKAWNADRVAFTVELGKQRFYREV